ncbi:ATP-binding protein [Sphaerimonospora cavernae]|uniref:ATP-binding protein n=1 Tax=Sphaerimonospora cavernae TaxID=1740611 RepID=A0ABV6UDX7_9ACTN
MRSIAHLAGADRAAQTVARQDGRTAHNLLHVNHRPGGIILPGRAHRRTATTSNGHDPGAWMDPQGHWPTHHRPARIAADHCQVTVAAWPLNREHGPQQVRRLLRSQVGEYLDDRAMGEAEIVVSELATNAFIHTDGPCELRIVDHAGVPLVCEIVDAGDQEDLIAKRLAEAATPLVPAAIADQADGVTRLDEGGFGLGIVASLTKGQCGVHPARLHPSGRAGKGVWFAVPALVCGPHETPRSPGEPGVIITIPCR